MPLTALVANRQSSLGYGQLHTISSDEWPEIKNDVPGHRLAPTRTPRGHPPCPIRAALLGFSVPGVGLDLAEIKNQRCLTADSRDGRHPVARNRRQWLAWDGRQLIE